MDFDKVLEAALTEFDRWDWGGGTSDANGYYIARIGDDDKPQIVQAHLFSIAIAENETRKRAIAAILAQAISRLTAERDALQHDISRHLSIMTEMQAEREGLRRALEAVEAWWLETGMKDAAGAPYAIFAVRAALSTPTESDAVAGGGQS